MSLHRRMLRPAGITLGLALAGTTLVAPASGAPSPDAADVAQRLTDAQRQTLTQAGDLSVPSTVVDTDIDTTSSEPVEVIVQLATPPATTALALAEAEGRELTGKEARAAVKASQQALDSLLKDTAAEDERRAAQRPSVRQQYTQAFNGAAVELPATDVEALAASDEVAAVWANDTWTVDLPETAAAAVGASAETDDVATLHGEGLTGAGVKVGVLDTGIDYTHPALADVYQGGYDLVDDDDDPMETTYADWQEAGGAEKDRNGNTYYTQHGTHVAGIIAGTDERGSWGAAGVAPEADIYAYRVLGPFGGGTTEDILAGMERALADGMDVVNMSLGGNVNDTQSPLSIAANHLTLAGVTTVLAAGNSGANGAFSLGSPAAAQLALTVGANDFAIEVATLGATVGTAGADLQLLARPTQDTIAELDGTTATIVDAGLGKASDYRYYDSGWQDVAAEGNVVLVQRGAISFQEKMERAADKGAAALLIVNNDPDEEHPPYYFGESDTYVPTFSVTTAQGAALTAAVADGAEVTFSGYGTTTTGGGNLADFSSRGPAKGNGDIKPEVTAPGVSVLSAIPAHMVDPENLDDHSTAYARLSGTSMATPYVAGSAALMLQHDEDLDPIELKARLMNTADPLDEDHSVFAIGAGEVDPYQAVHADTFLLTAEKASTLAQRDVTTATGSTPWSAASADDAEIGSDLSFGVHALGTELSDSRRLEIVNESTERARYTVDVVLDQGVGTRDAAAQGVTVSTKHQVQVAAGGSGTVRVDLDVPATAEAGTYGGYVVVTREGDDGEGYRVPFGFRLTETGFADFTFVKQVMTTNVTDVLAPQLEWGFALENHLRTVDFFVADTEGRDVGYIGSLDTVAAAEGVMYGPFGWIGGYYELTGDRDFPVSHALSTIEPGAHVLKVVGTDDAGRTFSESGTFFVDNTAPEMVVDREGDVIEVPSGESSYAIGGTLVDGETAAMRAAGLDVDQSANRFLAYTYSAFMPSDQIRPEADGAFSYTSSFGPSPMATHRYRGIDAAGNVADQLEYTVLTAGDAYIDGQNDVEYVAPGEDLTTTFTHHHAEDLGTVRVTFRYDAARTEVVDVRPAEGLAAYGDPTVEIEIPEADSGLVQASVTLTFDGETPATAEELPLLDVVTRTLEDGPWSQTAGPVTVSVYVHDAEGGFVRTWRRFDVARNLPQTVAVTGTFLAQGLFTPELVFDPERDHSDVGGEVVLTAPDGTSTTPRITADGTFSVHVPVTTEPYVLSATLPGHLDYRTEVTVGHELADGRVLGTPAQGVVQLYGGDVTGDDVVDILDALAIKDAAGTADRAADVNADGVVDGQDLTLVERNWLMRNPSAETVPDPRDRKGSWTLEDVQAALAG